MPLAPGHSAIGSNIAELMHTGKYPQRQAIAIAESNARRHPRALGGSNMPMQGMPNMQPNMVASPNKTMPAPPMAQFGQPMMPRKSGGHVPQFAAGGFPDSSEASPWYAREEGRADQLHVGGLFGGSAPGRADTLPRDVPVDLHIIPSDVVAAVGQGNTLSGGNILSGMFHSLPYGISGSGGHGAPQLRAPAAPRPMAPESTGGRKTGDGGKTVPIAASSGEFNVNPAGVYRTGLKAAQGMKLDPVKLTPRKVMDLGHDVIDKFILHVRAKEIKDAKKRAPPKRD